MRQHQIIAFVVLAIALTACGTSQAPEQPSVETIVAGTLQALTAVPVEPVATEINGTPITFSKLSLVIPQGLASSITEEKIEVSPPSEGMPWWEVYPTHVQYPITGYNVAEISHDPKIYVYPIAEYIAINEVIAQNVDVIKSLSNSTNQPLPENLPFLPTFNAGQMFHSNFGTVTFQNGSGIRYITAFSQFPHPIYNITMFYTFQGITDDGLYYVSAVLPINIGFLIGYPIPTDQGDFEFIQSEVERVTEQLNNSKPEAFSPSMLTLDAMIQSMTVTGIP